MQNRAVKAWMLLEGREGVAEDCNGAFELVEEGARLGCHHCQGVMARCYRRGCGCVSDQARSLELARESSGKGSRYGQWVLGVCYRYVGGGVAEDYAQALALFQLAAAQNLDWAQYSLGDMYYNGVGVAEDFAEALRLFQLAAAQGHPEALFYVAECHEEGRGVRKSKAAAIRWYRSAQAAGNTDISFAKDCMLLLLTTLPLRKTEVDDIAMHDMNYTHQVTLVGIAEHHTGSAACPVSAPNKCDSAAVTVCNLHSCCSLPAAPLRVTRYRPCVSSNASINHMAAVWHVTSIAAIVSLEAWG
jgi:hypothetical protein